MTHPDTCPACNVPVDSILDDEHWQCPKCGLNNLPRVEDWMSEDLDGLADLPDDETQ